VSHIRRLANGRWQARFRGPDGREHARNFTRKVDATRFLTTVDAGKLRGEWTDPQLGRMKLEEFWPELQRKLATRIRPSTLALYEMLWRLHIGPGLGGRSMASITRYRIEEFVAALEDRGVGEATIGAALRLLHRILEAATAEGLVATNQAHGVRPPALPHRTMRFLTLDQVDDLVAATPDGWKAFVMLAAWGGLRFGEMAALTTDRVDFARKQVRVEETLSEVGGHLHTGPTKTKAYRSVALPSFVMEAIRARFEEWPREPRLVFWSPEGGPVRRSNFRTRVWLPAVRAAGLEPLRIHDYADVRVMPTCRHPCRSAGVGSPKLSA
jgi:integrase